MKYTRSLSKLCEITDMKVAAELSELDKLSSKINEIEALIQSLRQEKEQGVIELERLINSRLGKISDYYKIRSAIAALNGRMLVLDTRIESAKENISEIMVEIEKVNEKISFLRKKKKKFEKLLSGDYEHE